MIDSLSLTFFGQIIAALIGTTAFSVLFGVPRKYYITCGVVGTTGWIVYLGMTRFLGASPTEASLISTLVITFLSRLLSVIEKCPFTVFLITGIFPLVPGGGIFWTIYYIVSNDLQAALQSGFVAIKVSVAIVLGIIIILEMPNTLFRNAGIRLKKLYKRFHSQNS